MNQQLEVFRNRFRFKHEGAGLLGVERECFVTDETGRIVPEAPRVISHAERTWQVMQPPTGYNGKPVYSDTLFGYELSACQVETRTYPSSLADLPGALEGPARELDRTLRELGLRALHTEVAPADMPLDVYPDPTGRYAKITADMPRDVLLAACRVAGTHVHVGMPDHETALRVYNHVAAFTNQLCEEAGGLESERLQIYKVVAPEREPPPYASWEEFYAVALRKGFWDNPRNCWTLIRISVHGTIEFRMFGATASHDCIVRWAGRCHQLCVAAM